MARFLIKFDRDKEIELDDNLELQDRIKLCQGLIDTYPDYFVYTLPKNSTDVNISGLKVETRLDIMASYILAGSKRYKEDGLLSEYKEKLVAYNEINMSDLE